jgi:flagellar P-ring protein precursor FlgI
MPKLTLKALTIVVVLGLTTFTQPAEADRLLDLCHVVGVRDNQLVGYGVVTGLDGTGDDVSAPFAMQSLRALLRRLGVQIDQKQLRLRNVAAVLVTTDIPAFARSGARLDVTVSSIGNARSLRGGVLVQTPMRGADRRTYAVAQGPLVVGGFGASGGSGSSVKAGTTNTARVPSGALVEREVQSVITRDGAITLALHRPNFVTTHRVVEAINDKFGKGTATAVDGGTVTLKLPKEFQKQPVALLAGLNDIEVKPEIEAQVIINERTGTIVAGGDVRLLPVAIAQGGITITIQEKPRVEQPNPFGRGTTKVVEDSQVESTEPVPGVAYLEGAASLGEVAQALSTFGVPPRELASILQALKAAGALRAEVKVQ